jgi:hypothetical protein
VEQAFVAASHHCMRATKSKRVASMRAPGHASARMRSRSWCVPVGPLAAGSVSPSSVRRRIGWPSLACSSRCCSSLRTRVSIPQKLATRALRAEGVLGLQLAATVLVRLDEEQRARQVGAHALRAARTQRIVLSTRVPKASASPAQRLNSGGNPLRGSAAGKNSAWRCPWSVLPVEDRRHAGAGGRRHDPHRARPAGLVDEQRRARGRIRP